MRLLFEGGRGSPQCVDVVAGFAHNEWLKSTPRFANGRKNKRDPLSRPVKVGAEIVQPIFLDSLGQTPAEVGDDASGSFLDSPIAHFPQRYLFANLHDFDMIQVSRVSADDSASYINVTLFQDPSLRSPHKALREPVRDSARLLNQPCGPQMPCISEGTGDYVAGQDMRGVGVGVSEKPGECDDLPVVGIIMSLRKEFDH